MTNITSTRPQSQAYAPSASPTAGLSGRRGALGARALAAFAAACLALSGCASVGVKVDEQAMARFEKGKTTYAEVVRSLGQPTSSVVDSNGQRMIMYTYAQAQTRPESFVPIVGLFAGGADVKSSNVMFTFDRSDRLVSYSSSATQLGAGTGLASGTQANDRVVNQPRSDKP
jgi:sulfur carrier protein ThiS